MPSFTLTFQEYLEHRHSDEPPKRDSAKALIVLSVLLAVIAFAILLLSPPLSESAAYRRRGLAVLGFLFAAYLWRKEPALARSSDMKTKSSEYRHSFSEERNFSFDGAGWTYSSRLGTTRTSWSELDYFKEGELLLNLSSAGIVQPVATRILEPTELIAIREKANRVFADRAASKLFTIEYRVTAWDYVNANLLDEWRKRNFYTLTTLIFIVLLFGYLFYQTHQGYICVPKFRTPAFIFLLAMMLFLAALHFFQSFITYQGVRKHFPQTTAELTDTEVLFRNDAYLLATRFSEFDDFAFNRRVFLLYLRPHLFFILPRRTLSQAASTGLRDFLKQRIGTSALSTLTASPR